MKRLNLRQWSLLLFSFLLVVSFQNCTQTSFQQALDSKEASLASIQTQSLPNINQDNGSSVPEVLDKTAPIVTISNPPASVTGSKSHSFILVAQDDLSGVARIECALGSASFSVCASPHNISNLVDGTYTYKVRAIDKAGNISVIQTVMWKVDSTAPVLTLTSQPNALVNVKTASFSFSGTDSGVAITSFQCSIDNGAYSSCSSPKAYSGLAEGSHTFRFRGVDSIGNTSAITSYMWTVDSVVPVVTISSGPSSSMTTAETATFVFASSDVTSGINSSQTQCQLDSQAYASCSSPKSYSGLTAGSHTVKVRVVDNASNQTVSSTYSWSVQAVVVTPPPTGGGSGSTLPLYTLKTPTTGYIGGAPTYKGAFLIDPGTYGASSLANYAGPTKIAAGTSGSRMFLTGDDEGAGGMPYFAEANIPALVTGSNINTLNVGSIVQGYRDLNQDFSTMVTTPTIGGMYYDAPTHPLDPSYVGTGQLFISASVYYDASQSENRNYALYRNASQLATSAKHGIFRIEGEAHIDGYINKIPAEFLSAFKGSINGTHFVGGGKEAAIINRATSGPSAFVVRLADMGPSLSPSFVSTIAALDYPQDYTLSGSRAIWSAPPVGFTLWNAKSSAVAGFIIPGTRTIMFIGTNWNGVGADGKTIIYHENDKAGVFCGGYCPYVVNAITNYYWLYDLNDLAKTIADPVNYKPWSHRPYEHGAFPSFPFTSPSRGISGAYYDYVNSRLVLALQGGAVDRPGFEYGVPSFAVFDLGVSN